MSHIIFSCKIFLLTLFVRGKHDRRLRRFRPTSTEIVRRVFLAVIKIFYNRIRYEKLQLPTDQLTELRKMNSAVNPTISPESD